MHSNKWVLDSQPSWCHPIANQGLWVNSRSICDKSTNGEKDRFRVEKFHNVPRNSHTIYIGTRCLSLIYPLLYSALIRWWSNAAERKPGPDIVCQNTTGKQLMTRRRNEARSSGETLGFSFGEKPLSAHGRRPTWWTPPCRRGGILFFYTTSIRVNVCFCTHAATADLNAVTTELRFHARRRSLFRLLPKKKKEKLPPRFHMNKRLLCAHFYQPSLSYWEQSAPGSADGEILQSHQQLWDKC